MEQKSEVNCLIENKNMTERMVEVKKVGKARALFDTSSATIISSTAYLTCYSRRGAMSPTPRN